LARCSKKKSARQKKLRELMTKARPSRIREIEHSVSGEKLSLLAVFARPEDEAFGPSGTLAKYAGEGVRVSLVTAFRELANLATLRSGELALSTHGGASMPRDMLCSCRAAGINRICLDHAGAAASIARADVMLERLVRLIREVQPQVIVTYGPQGFSGDSDQMLVNHVATRVFRMAGDSGEFPQHLSDGLEPYKPQKLYYSVLPASILTRWGLDRLNAVPDDEVTTVLDVSPYSELKLKAVYCQRHHVLDYTRWLDSSRGLQWNEEHFILAASNLGRRSKRERDLFAGIR
jgi:LmbE family N-acetylglucosaminyl deacetylase